MYKNFYKTKNLLNDLKNVKTNIPIYDKKNKLVTILKPIGVICGVTPSTNPIATALNYIINSIKCRNSIIICPNPRTYNTSNELINLIKEMNMKCFSMEVGSSLYFKQTYQALYTFKEKMKSIVFMENFCFIKKGLYIQI